jgi:hypothetical protein
MIPDGEPCPIWFIVHGDSPQVDPEKVTAYSRGDIDDLKNLINVRRRDIPASEMLLWKVNCSISVSRRTMEEREAFTKRIKDICLPDPESPDAYKVDRDIQILDGAQLLSSYWSVSPAKGLHVIVQQLCMLSSLIQCL